MGKLVRFHEPSNQGGFGNAAIGWRNGFKRLPIKIILSGN
jgi:hypothetical protein